MLSSITHQDVIKDNPSLITSFEIILLQSVLEDIHTGDVTTQALIKERQQKDVFHLIAKEPIIICGLFFIEYLTSHRMKNVLFKASYCDGDCIQKQNIIASLEGSLVDILPYERFILNLLQHLSGISTVTHQWLELLKESSIQLLDTRKTLPGYRLLEKYATRIAGATNHRLGLYDMYMIKDTHLHSHEDIDKTLNCIHEHNKKHHVPPLMVELECHHLELLKKIDFKKVDVIMLDNMDLNTLEKAIQMIAGRAKIEVSGNLRLKDIRALLDYPINYISTGSITHSSAAVDISMVRRKPL